MLFNKRDKMKKTMIYLEDEKHLLLKKKAEAEGKSLASIIRKAIDEFLLPKNEISDYFSFVGIAKGEKNGKTSEKAEEEIKKALR